MSFQFFLLFFYSPNINAIVFLLVYTETANSFIIIILKHNCYFETGSDSVAWPGVERWPFLLGIPNAVIAAIHCHTCCPPVTHNGTTRCTTLSSYTSPGYIFKGLGIFNIDFIDIYLLQIMSRFRKIISFD